MRWYHILAAIISIPTLDIAVKADGLGPFTAGVTVFALAWVGMWAFEQLEATKGIKS